jgi:hypothetical protein
MVHAAVGGWALVCFSTLINRGAVHEHSKSTNSIPVERQTSSSRPATVPCCLVAITEALRCESASTNNYWNCSVTFFLNVRGNTESVSFVQRTIYSDG